MEQDVELAAQIDRISSAWMEGLLHRSGALPATSRLKSVALDSSISAGRGFMSRVVRAELEYDGAAGGAPASVIIKLPSDDKARFALGQSVRTYEREMRFYAELAASTPVRVPVCYYAADDAVLGSPVIVMEDAKDWTTPDQIYGLTQTQVECVLREVAKLHAHWWNRPELDRLTWIPPQPWDVRRLFEAAWPEFKARYAGWLSKTDLAFGDRLADSCAALERALVRPPPTLVHCDLRADNLMLDGPAAGEAVMLLDWQVISRTAAGLDVARLVCGSLERGLPQSGYRALCALWHQRLIELGVAGYSEAEAWRDFRVGLLLALSIPVCFHSNLSHEGARAIRLLEALTHRMFRVAEECDALGSLEGL